MGYVRTNLGEPVVPKTGAMIGPKKAQYTYSLEVGSSRQPELIPLSGVSAERRGYYYREKHGFYPQPELGDPDKNISGLGIGPKIRGFADWFKRYSEMMEELDAFMKEGGAAEIAYEKAVGITSEIDFLQQALTMLHKNKQVNDDTFKRYLRNTMDLRDRVSKSMIEKTEPLKYLWNYFGQILSEGLTMGLRLIYPITRQIYQEAKDLEAKIIKLIKKAKDKGMEKDPRVIILQELTFGDYRKVPIEEIEKYQNLAFEEYKKSEFVWKFLVPVDVIYGVITMNLHDFVTGIKNIYLEGGINIDEVTGLSGIGKMVSAKDLKNPKTIILKAVGFIGSGLLIYLAVKFIAWDLGRTVTNGLGSLGVIVGLSILGIIGYFLIKQKFPQEITTSIAGLVKEPVSPTAEYRYKPRPKSVFGERKIRGYAKKYVTPEYTVT